MTPRFLHENETIFPRAREFDPQRWLDAAPPDRERMQKYLSNFGRGSRQCAGMKLAYAEIYLALAYLFRRLERRVKLYDTQRERDVDYVHDYFILRRASKAEESGWLRIL
jgi:cytochrome P450